MGKSIVDRLLGESGVHLYIENLNVLLPRTFEPKPHIDQRITLRYVGGFGVAVDEDVQPFEAWLKVWADIGHDDYFELSDRIKTPKQLYRDYLSWAAMHFYPRCVDFSNEEDKEDMMFSRPIRLRADGRTVRFNIVDTVNCNSEEYGEHRVCVFNQLSFLARGIVQYGGNTTEYTPVEKKEALGSWSMETSTPGKKSKHLKGIKTPEIAP